MFDPIFLIYFSHLLFFSIYIDAKVFSIYKTTVSYNFDDVSLVVAIEKLKIDNRNFVLSMENW